MPALSSLAAVACTSYDSLKQLSRALPNCLLPAEHLFCPAENSKIIFKHYCFCRLPVVDNDSFGLPHNIDTIS